MGFWSRRVGPEAVVRGSAHAVGGVVVQDEPHLLGEVVDIMRLIREAGFAFDDFVFGGGAVGRDDGDSAAEGLDRGERIDLVPDGGDGHRSGVAHFFEDLVAVEPTREGGLFVADVFDRLHQRTIAEDPDFGADLLGGFDKDLGIFFDRKSAGKDDCAVLGDVDSGLFDRLDGVAHHVELGVLRQVLAEGVNALLAEDSEVVNLARHSRFAALDHPAIDLGPLGQDGSGVGAMGAKALDSARLEGADLVGLLVEELALGAGDVVVVEAGNDLRATVERGVDDAGRSSGFPEVGVDDGVFGVAEIEDFLQFVVGGLEVRHLDEAGDVHPLFGLADGVELDVFEASEVRIDVFEATEEVDLVTGVGEVFGAEERAFRGSAADHCVVVNDDDPHLGSLFQFPFPGGADDGFEVAVVGDPAEESFGVAWVGVETWRVSGAPILVFNGYRFARDFCGHIDDLFDAVAFAAAEVDLDRVATVDEVLKGFDVAAGEVFDVDVIANRGSVGCVVVGAKDADVGPFAGDGLEDERYEVRLGIVDFADLAIGVSAGRVEVS